MTLSSALNAANAGLNVTGHRAAIASNNIANVQTPGYARREAVLTEGGGGVAVAGLTRSVDEALTETRRTAQTSSSGTAVMRDVLARLDEPLGAPDSQSGLFAAFSRMQGDLETLRNTPESIAAQDVAAASLKELVTSISRTAQTLRNERERMDSELATDIESANQIMREIYDLNTDIVSAQANGRDNSALIDRRTQTLDRLADIIPVNTHSQGNGGVRVTTPSGLTLVGATVHEIEFTPARSFSLQETTTEAGGRLSIPTIDGLPIGPGSNQHAVSEGRIYAWMQMRDTAIPQRANDLDQYVFDLADAFSSAGADLITDNGAPVNAANVAGLASRVTLNAAVDPARGGEAYRLRDGLAAVQEGPPSDDTLLTALTQAANPFADTLASLISTASSETFRAERIHTGNESRLTTLSDAETAKTAVDLDFELQNLLTIEQAYAANARVIRTVDDMFDTLLRI